MEFAEENNPRFSNKREYGVDTHDLQYYQNSLLHMKDNSIGTSTRDLSRYANEEVIPKEAKKTIMVSRDIQTDDVGTCVVPNHLMLQPCQTESYEKQAKEYRCTEKASLCASTAMLPPLYSSIFPNGSNLIQLSSTGKMCCNGYVELPPKEKSEFPPD